MSTITIRLPQAEKAILDDVCKTTGRTQTDVLREFIRSLEQKKPS
ncbi:MAG: CopG family transcriptional regulator [Leptolyngbya foveolarum]|uniref:CopG family transcriptional regulator n=1 Tax=Leptolyngbya foveolarum TaxID=47253 RepID=A0A2W4UE89_9CYAN|nr:MAG: CopG family transcriptional regulator [Leptolyngbya foveolarum]